MLPISRILIGDALTGQQLKAAIDAGLAKADLLIGYQVAFKRAMEWSASTEMPGPGVYVLEGRRWDYDPSTHPIGTTTTTETLQIGDFGLDMYDAAQRQLVWRGDAGQDN